MARKIKPIHPGEVLKEDFLDPMKVTPYKLSKDTGISQTMVGRIIKGESSVSTEVGMILSKYFGMNSQFFIRIQARYDHDMATDNKKLRRRLDKINPIKYAS